MEGIDTEKKIIGELSEDLKYSKNNLESFLTRIPDIYNKYLLRYYSTKRKVDEYQEKIKMRYIERYSYYKMDFEISLSPQEIKSFIESDTELTELRSALAKAESLLDLFEKCLRNIESTRWDIKNLIEWTKLQQC